MGRTRFVIFMIVIALSANPKANLYAIELNTICNPHQNCTIDSSYSSIENSTPFSVNTINIGDNYQYNTITNFINTSNITSTDNQTFRFGDRGSSVRGDIVSFINYGTISGGIYMGNTESPTPLGIITNYGEMRGIWATRQNITINNQGVIKTNEGSYNGNAAHFFFTASSANLYIDSYLMKIVESQNEFNNFTGYADKTNNKNSHLIVSGGSVGFKDSNSKIVIDFDTTSGFELGKAYSLSKLITNQDGNAIYSLPFSRIVLKNRDFYSLTQSGDSFIVNTASNGGSSGGVVINTELTESRKANVKAMNNLFASSNAIMFKNQRNKTKRTTQKRVIRKVQKVSNLFYDNNFVASNAKDLLKSNETFFYDNTQIASNDANIRAIRLKRLPSKNQYRLNQNTNRKNPSANSANQTKTKTAIRPANKDKYYFILMPFVNHNYYFSAGNYNLSGLDGGFITAFSGKLNYANALGAHFGFSYGSLGDKNDKAFSIKSVNLMLGLNYKLDLVYDMFIKARGDFFYFANEVSSEQVAKIKPNDLGFGISVAFGKDFDLGDAGILGAEIGIDYKGLSTNSVSVKSALDNSAMQNYDKSLYNLIYADLGVNYRKYWGYFGLNLGAGIRGNLAHKLATSKVVVSNNTINILLDNDKFLGYVNAGVSYVLNKANYAMEFGLNYYGNFGDRSMSNGGSFEWRVSF